MSELSTMDTDAIAAGARARAALDRREIAGGMITTASRLEELSYGEIAAAVALLKVVIRQLKWMSLYASVIALNAADQMFIRLFHH